jgi:hypothetical protein
MLVAALAIELSGCAQGSAYLSRITGRHRDDQKLVDVDGKTKKKGSSTAKKSDSLRDKAGDSQLAKQSPGKPKVQSSDDSKSQFAAKETTKPAKKTATNPSDPFTSDEFDALAAARERAGKKAQSEIDHELTDLAARDNPNGPLKPSARRPGTATEGRERVQEVAHKVEETKTDDNAAGLPEWAQEDVASPRREVAVKRQAVEAEAAGEEPNVRRNAGDIRGTMRTSSKETMPARGTAELSPDFTDLISLCPDAQGELRRLVLGLKDGDTEGLKRGIHRIGRIGPDAQLAAPALIRLLKHRDGFVRTHSALALARMQASPPEAVQTVVDGLKSTDPGLRSFAAAVLAEMGPQAADALSTLAESLNDRDGYVRLHAAEVLIRYDRWSYPALETLLAGLSDKDENIRWLATYSLAELAPESQDTVDALLNATRDPVLKVKVGAVYALGEIGPFAKSAGDELRKLADSTANQELQSAVLYALQQIEQ